MTLGPPPDFPRPPTVEELADRSYVEGPIPQVIEGHDFEAISRFKDGSYGGRCGDFVEQVTGLPLNRTYVGSGLEVKKFFTNPQAGTKDYPVKTGDLVVEDQGTSDGHIAIISGVHKDRLTGRLFYNVIESNQGNSGKISTSRYLMGDDPKIVGFVTYLGKDGERPVYLTPTKRAELDKLNASAPKGWMVDPLTGRLAKRPEAAVPQFTAR